MFHSKREYFFLTYLIGITRNAVAVAHEVTAAAVLRLHPIVDRVSVHQASTLLSTLTIPLRLHCQTLLSIHADFVGVYTLTHAAAL